MRPVINESLVPFVMLKHSKSKLNDNRYKLLSNSLILQKEDGLSNINKLTTILNVNFYRTFTHLYVDVGI